MPAPAPTAADRPAPPVLVLRDRDASFETTRLTTLVADKVAGADVIAFRPPAVAAVYRDVTVRLRRRPDTVLHAFGGLALAVALTARGGTVAYTATKPPRPRDIAWLRAAGRYRPVTVICDSDAERRRWVTGGIAPDRCVLVRPGVSLATPPAARVEARRRFGYAEGERVVFAPMPPAGPARAVALWTASLSNVLDAKFLMLAWNPPGGRDFDVLRRRLIDPQAVRAFADPTPDAGFAAADIVLLPPGDRVSPTVMALAMASGRPVAAAATAAVCELLEDRHTALLARDPTPKALAWKLAELRDDAALGRQIADRARAEAYDLLLVSRLLRDLRNVYASLGAGAGQDQQTA